MTTVREPATTTPASHTAAPAAVPPSCRVSILAGESHQIDLVLPSAAPLNTLADPTVIAINKVLRGRGAAELPPAAYEFARAAGMSHWPSDVSLAGHNIVDGDVLALLPAGTAERYGPVVENVSTALAQYASDHFVRVTAQTALAVAAVIIGGALGVASLLLWRLRWAHESALLVPILFAAVTIGLIGTVAIGVRLGAGRAVTDGAGWTALVTAALAAATIPPGAPRRSARISRRDHRAGGTVADGAAHRRYWSAAAAIVTAGFGAAAVALARMYWDVPGPRIAVAVLIAVLVAVSAAPTVALRMAKVPRQTFGSITGRDIFARAPGQPEDTVSPVEDRPTGRRHPDRRTGGGRGAQVQHRADGRAARRRRRAVPAAWVAVSPDGEREWANLVVLGAVAAILILRARAFRDRRHAIILVGAAVAGLIGAAAKYGLHAPPTDTSATLVAAGAALGIAALGLVAATVVPPRVFSPPVRKVVEYTEYILLTIAGSVRRMGARPTALHPLPLMHRRPAARGPHLRRQRLPLLLGANVLMPATAVALEPPVIDPAALPPDDTPGPDQEMKQQNTCAAPLTVATPDVTQPAPGNAMLDVTKAWKYSTGAGVTVGLIDTGVTPSPRFPALFAGGDYVMGDENGGLFDCDSHGTVVASIIAAQPSDPGRQAAADAAGRQAAAASSWCRGVTVPDHTAPCATEAQHGHGHRAATSTAACRTARRGTRGAGCRARRG